MKKWLILFTIVIAFVLVSSGCSSSSQKTAQRDSYTSTAYQTLAPAPAPAPAMPPINVGSAPNVKPGYTSGPGNTAAPESQQSSGETSYSQDNTLTADRKIIRTGNMQLVVRDIATALDDVVKIAADNGGYVISSQKWKDNQRNFGSISIRILAENYDKTVFALRALAISVTSETTSTEDVTEEYTDLTSKLKNLEATEAQLLKIMENAIKTEDVLAVQRELTVVRGNIEQTKGRMLYIERTTSTSLIQIQLNESVFGLKFSADNVRVNTNEAVTFIPEVTGGFGPFNYQWNFGDGEKSTEVSPRHAYKKGGDYSVSLMVTDDKGYTNQVVRDRYINVQGSWNAGSVAGAAWNALKIFAKAVANVLIWVVTFAPVWIIIGAIVWFALYLKKRRSRKVAEKKLQPPDNVQ